MSGHTSDQRSQVHKLINAFTHASKCLEDPQKGPQGTQIAVKVLISLVVLAAIQLEKVYGINFIPHRYSYENPP